MRALVGAGVLAVSLLAGGCGGNQYTSYCNEVKDQQSTITAAAGGDASTGLLAVLPAFRELQDKAPDDISADWTTVVRALEGLQTALRGAGVDPSTFDPAHPPSGLTAAQKATIATAANALSADDVAASLSSVEQEARDVCHTPLSLV